jgi:hypothetical protein
LIRSPLLIRSRYLLDGFVWSVPHKFDGIVRFGWFLFVMLERDGAVVVTGRE